MSDVSDRHPLRRFSDRVGDYVRYRPSYPAALLACLRSKTGLGPGTAVADVGSGTGIFARLLLAAGAPVFAVEPNRAMREAAEADLSGQDGFRSIDGTAEATGLPDASVSLVTCAQAFHWFDLAAARREFHRILVPGGWCAVVWNTPVLDSSAFATGYERIKQDFGTDFRQVRHENKRGHDDLAAFFGPGGWERWTFANFQLFDLEGLKGRMRSSSYSPKEGEPAYGPMMTALEDLFGQCQKDGSVRMELETELFLGQPG